MKYGLFLFIFVSIILPFSVVSAATDPGVKPSSFFYVFDTFFEGLDLLFTFSAEKKANKALGYAEERLSEAKEEAEDNKPEGVDEAMKSYEASMSLATEKSKELENESETEILLNTISSNTLKHQEVLRSVYDQVPEEAKEAILKAIAISHNRQEEADKQIGALKKEVAQLKDEIGQLQEKLKEKDVEQKPSLTPSQKQGGELKKPTQTPIPPTATPTPDKSLKELREELERRLKELEKTPTPTPWPQPTSIPKPTYFPQPPVPFEPTPTPVPPKPTPIPVFLKSDEFIDTSWRIRVNPDNTVSENYQLKVIREGLPSEVGLNVKSITFELYYNDHTTLLDLNICKASMDVTRNDGRILTPELSMPITSNPFTWNVFTPRAWNIPAVPLGVENNIRIGLNCEDPTKSGTELWIWKSLMETDKIIYLKLLSADGAIIERN